MLLFERIPTLAPEQVMTQTGVSELIQVPTSFRVDPYKGFTDRARKVMQIAQIEAIRVGRKYIGSEDILIGLIKEGSGVSSCVLRSFDLDSVKIHQTAEEIAREYSLEPSESIPFDDIINSIITGGNKEMTLLGHHHIETGHLLLALIKKEDCLACQILKKRGIAIEKIRETILDLVVNHIEYRFCVTNSEDSKLQTFLAKELRIDLPPNMEISEITVTMKKRTLVP